nr:UDP-glucuronosyl/UDP-glucosyltransferase [Tanacetum cinerariifolium]
MLHSSQAMEWVTYRLFLSLQFVWSLNMTFKVLFTFSLYLPSMDREGEGDQYVDLSGTVEVPGCSPIRIQDLQEFACIFVNTWDDLEPVSLNAVKHEPFFLNIPTPPVQPIGPLIKQIEPVVIEYEKEMIAWLDKQPKDSRFVMVVRNPSDYAAAAAFFNVGSESDDPRTYLPDGFLERTKGTGLVVSSWPPQVSGIF